jgi:hypothetical protein
MIFLFGTSAASASGDVAVKQQMKDLCLNARFFQMIRGCNYVVNSGDFEDDKVTLGIAEYNLKKAQDELQRRSDNAAKSAKRSEEERLADDKKRAAKEKFEGEKQRKLEAEAVRSNPSLLDASSAHFSYKMAISRCGGGDAYACKNVLSSKLSRNDNLNRSRAEKALKKIDFSSLSGELRESSLRAVELATNECEEQDFSNQWLLERALQSCLIIISQRVFNNQGDQLAVAYSNRARAYLYKYALDWQIKLARRKNKGEFVWPQSPADLQLVIGHREPLDQAHRFLSIAREFHLDFLRESGVQEARRGQMIKSTAWFHNRHELAEALSDLNSPRLFLSKMKAMRFAQPIQYITRENLGDKVNCLRRVDQFALSICKRALESNLWGGDVKGLIEAKIDSLVVMAKKVESGNAGKHELLFAQIDFTGMSATSAHALKAFYNGDKEAATAAFSGGKPEATKFIARYALSYPTFCNDNIDFFTLQFADIVTPGFYQSGALRGLRDETATTTTPGSSARIKVLHGFKPLILDTEIYAVFGHTGLGSFFDTVGPCNGDFLTRLHMNMKVYYQSM